MKTLSGIFSKCKPMVLAAALVLGGCMVHEWPDETTPAPLEVEMVFDTEFLPLRDVEYTKKTKDSPEDYNIRYQIRAYRSLNTGGYDAVSQCEFVFLKTDVSSPDNTVTIEIPDGDYMFRVWADYVDDGKLDDKYYITKDFSDILISEPYVGDTDFRDAFEGSTPVTVVRKGSNVQAQKERVEMQRPLAKFQFVATDFYDLVTKAMENNLGKEEYEKYLNERREGQLTASPSDADFTFDVSSTDYIPSDGTKAPWDPTKAPGFDPEDYTIVFYYTSFLPTEYNLITGKPMEAKMGMQFTSTLAPLNEEEAMIGFDYVIVNGNESSVNLQVALYSPEGDLMSLSNSVTVPIVRGKVTTVRGKFLTLQTNGGIGIDPVFDGEFNLVF
ncbi:MAG: DUF6562 domain-containing protein [Candidatus Cryptobacteroides sp.]